jgi:hypothetical protein
MVFFQKIGDWLAPKSDSQTYKFLLKKKTYFRIIISLYCLVLPCKSTTFATRFENFRKEQMSGYKPFSVYNLALDQRISDPGCGEIGRHVRLRI